VGGKEGEGRRGEEGGERRREGGRRKGGRKEGEERGPQYQNNIHAQLSTFNHP